MASPNPHCGHLLSLRPGHSDRADQRADRSLQGLHTNMNIRDTTRLACSAGLASTSLPSAAHHSQYRLAQKSPNSRGSRFQSTWNISARGTKPLGTSDLANSLTGSAFHAKSKQPLDPSIPLQGQTPPVRHTTTRILGYPFWDVRQRRAPIVDLLPCLDTLALQTHMPCKPGPHANSPAFRVQPF